MAVYWENVRWNDISKDQQNFYEAGLLKLNCDKALFELNWKPTLTFEETVKITVEWYKHYFQNRNGAAEVSMYQYAKSQIEYYAQQAARKDISWAK